MNVKVGDKVIIANNLWSKLNPYKHNQKVIVETITYAGERCFSSYRKCAPQSGSDECLYYSQKNGQQHYSGGKCKAYLLDSKEAQEVCQATYSEYKEKSIVENDNKIKQLLAEIEDVKLRGYHGNLLNLKKYSDYMDEIGIEITI